MTSFISSASAQGQRTEQQDRYLCSRIPQDPLKELHGWLMAVMDGHGGAQTSERISQELLPQFEEAFVNHGGQIDRSLRAVVHTLAEKTAQDISGSSLAIAYLSVQEGCVYTAVLGDSPIVVLDKTGKVQICPIHNVRINLEEREAALSRGGAYREGYLEDDQRPGFGLQMSRALGDKELSRVLKRDPEIDRFELGPQSIILVASDGILDAMNLTVEIQLKRILGLAQQGLDAAGLIEDALKRDTGDNVTVIVWKLVGS